MSKNLTRKGLAFGALVALSASAFAGAPAYAADSIVLAADATVDTTLAVPTTETFTLNASLGAGSTADPAKLRFKITQGGGTRAVSATYSTTTVGAVVSSGSATSVAAADVSKYAALPATLPTGTTKNTLALSLTSGAYDDATQTVTVLAFIDQNNNGTYESATDTVSTSVDVKFLKYSEITTSTTITAPTAGDTKATALVKFTNVNGQLLDAKKVGANFTSGTDGSLSAADAAINGNLATTGVVTSNGHGYSVGDVVTLASSSDDGAYQVTAADTNTFTLYKATAFTADATVTTARTPVLRSGVAYSTTKGGFSYTTGTLDTAFAKNTAVKVQPLFNSAVITTATSNSIGTAETASVVTRVLGSFTGSHVLSTTAESNAATGTVTAPASGSATNAVAINTEKKVYFLAKDTTATTAKALAGQKVTVKVTTDMVLTSSVTLTVNGTTYTNKDALPGNTAGTVAEITGTTDADGKFYVTYTTAGYTAAANKIVTFVATAENSTATVIGTETDRVYTTYVANSEGNKVATTDGAAVSVETVTIDQFGGIPADGKFQISAVLVSNAQSTTADSGTGSDTFANVVSGKANLSLKDNETGKGNVVFGLTRYTVNASGVASAPTNFGGSSITAAALGNIQGSVSFTLAVVDAVDLTVGKIVLGHTDATEFNLNAAETAYVTTEGAGPTKYNGTATDDTALLTYSDFKSVDGRVIAVEAPTMLNLAGTSSAAATDGNATAGGVVIAGLASSATTATHGGIAVPSSQITISGTGMQFSASQDNKTVWGADKLTINADASGKFTFTAYSHIAGKNVVTVTSGTGKSTVEVYYSDAVELAAKTVTVKVADGAVQFQSGRALDVVVTVVDKFGNPVKLDQATDSATFSIAQTGAGYLNTTTGSTDATGKFASKLITNAGDLGTSTITATVDFAAATSTDLVATNSSEFGITDVTDISSAGKAIYVNTEFAKGKVVTVYINGKRMPVKAAEATDNAVERKYTQRKAGTYTVTVRVSGGVVASEKIEIK